MGYVADLVDENAELSHSRASVAGVGDVRHRGIRSRRLGLNTERLVATQWKHGIRSCEGERIYAGRRNILVRNGIVLDGDAGDGHVRADGTLFARRSA